MIRDEAIKLIDEVQSIGSARSWNMLDKLLDLIDRVERGAHKDLQHWKDAVEDELVICGILNDSHKDPRKAIKDLIQWSVEVALDPLVSEAAQALYQKARKEALEEAAQKVEQMQGWKQYSSARPYVEQDLAAVTIRKLAEVPKP